jgi:hypothetical protein
MTYFRRTFAQGGDKIAVPIDDPSDGSVSYETGYGAQYSENPTTTATARRVERAKYNRLLSDITTEIQQYQQSGYPEFITTSDNGGSPFSYSKGATVRYSGSVYRSLIDSNTDLPTVASSWYPLTSLRPIFSAKSASYTFTDTDNIRIAGFTTGASDLNATLPSAANNTDRIIDIKKLDSGTGKVVVVGTIDDGTNVQLFNINDSISLCSNGTKWLVLNYPAPCGLIELDTGLGFGGSSSGETRIRCLTNATTEFGDAFAYVPRTATEADYILVNRSCLASVFYQERTTTENFFGITVDSSELSTNVQDITSIATRKGFALTTSASGSVGIVSIPDLKLTAGQKIRMHVGGTSGITNGNDKTIFRIQETRRLGV